MIAIYIMIGLLIGVAIASTFYRPIMLRRLTMLSKQHEGNLQKIRAAFDGAVMQLKLYSLHDESLYQSISAEELLQRKYVYVALHTNDIIALSTEVQGNAYYRQRILVSDILSGTSPQLNFAVDTSCTIVACALWTASVAGKHGQAFHLTAEAFDSKGGSYVITSIPKLNEKGEPDV